MSKWLRVVVTVGLLLPFLISAPTASANLYVFTTHTFTPCGSTGQSGPTQASCRTSYSTTWDDTDSNFTVTSGIQKWTVPATGSYSITAVGAAGAAGSSGAGGRGASLTGTFSLTAGQFIYLIVGQRGTFVAHVAGGGGGSFAYLSASDSNPLIAAGGGGGGGAGGGGAGINASTTTSGTNGNGMPSGAGVNGNGGTASSTTWYALGGAGWLSNGSLSNRSCTNNGVAAQAPRNGALGGNSNQAGTFGGFGGGGAPAMRCGAIGGGGGGGYSGGGPGGEPTDSAFSGGGGGGSYNGGTSPVVNGVTNSGEGSITITALTVAVSNFNSIALAGNTLSANFRTAINISANLDIASKVTFLANGKRIPGCINVRTSGTSPNIVATCSWKPNRRGVITISATAVPTSGGNAGTTQAPLSVNVAGRAGTR
jgi:hypothetical protein